MNLLNKIKAKISNVAKNTPGNSNKNSPTLNRSNRLNENVFSKAQENALKAMTIGGKPDLQARVAKLKEWGMNPDKMILEGAGTGRCGIAKDEATTQDEQIRVTDKLTKNYHNIIGNKHNCSLCGRPLKPSDMIEYSHYLSKSEIYFRQHAENVDWAHADCNRILGDRGSIQDWNDFYDTIKAILANREMTMKNVLISEETSRQFAFDERNRPYKITQ